MKTLAFLLLMSWMNVDTTSTPSKRYHSSSVLYEAVIQTLDSSSKQGFVISLTDSTISIAKAILQNSYVDSVTYKYTDINDIRLTRLKGSRSGNGLWKGLLIGFGLGAIVGLASGDDTGRILGFSAGTKALIYGVLLGLSGLLIGSIIGAFFKKKYHFKISGEKEQFDEMVSQLK